MNTIRITSPIAFMLFFMFKSLAYAGCEQCQKDPCECRVTQSTPLHEKNTEPTGQQITEEQIRQLSSGGVKDFSMGSLDTQNGPPSRAHQLCFTGTGNTVTDQSPTIDIPAWIPEIISLLPTIGAGNEEHIAQLSAISIGRSDITLAPTKNTPSATIIAQLSNETFVLFISNSTLYIANTVGIYGTSVHLVTYDLQQEVLAEKVMQTSHLRRTILDPLNLPLNIYVRHPPSDKETMD